MVAVMEVDMGCDGVQRSSICLRLDGEGRFTQEVAWNRASRRGSMEEWLQTWALEFAVSVQVLTLSLNGYVTLDMIFNTLVSQFIFL